MIPLDVDVIRDYNEDGSFHQHVFGKQCWIAPGRVDTVTPLSSQELSSSVLPVTTRSAVRYFSASGAVRVLYARQEAIAVARLVGRAMRGEDPTEPDYSFTP